MTAPKPVTTTEVYYLTPNEWFTGGRTQDALLRLTYTEVIKDSQHLLSSGFKLDAIYTSDENKIREAVLNLNIPRPIFLQGSTLPEQTLLAEVSKMLRESEDN